MSFWDLGAAADSPALFDERDGAVVSYAALRAHCDAFSARLPARHGKRLGFLLCRNDLASVAAYLAALRSGDCVALLPERQPPVALGQLVERYRPSWLFGGETAGVSLGSDSVWQGRALSVTTGPDPQRQPDLHPELALLLSTSGSTGSPRLVRLGYTALQHNATAITRYLELDADERAITTLPLHYAYGLSVLNSHLAAGAAVALTDAPVTTRPFWERFGAVGATSLAGVPTLWQMLLRMRLERMALPTLRTITQAGGALAPALIRQLDALAREQGWRFFVMYGQTEATARIAYVPPGQLADKCGAIGYAIPGGQLSLSAEGELVYRGPNVMLGYAESRDDLALGDTLHGVLATGDLARQDKDGCFWLTGRIKRIAKLFGHRINLDELEHWLEPHFGPVAVLDGDDALWVATPSDPLAVAAALRDHLAVHASGLRVEHMAALPLTASGKVDYPALRRHFTPPTPEHG